MRLRKLSRAAAGLGHRSSAAIATITRLCDSMSRPWSSAWIDQALALPLKRSTCFPVQWFGIGFGFGFVFAAVCSRGPALEPPRNKTSGAAGVVGRTRPSTQRPNNTQDRALCGENATQFRIRTMFIKMWNLCDFAHWLEGRPSKDCGSSKGFVAEPSSLSRRG